jgi:hypothetical protein
MQQRYTAPTQFQDTPTIRAGDELPERQYNQRQNPAPVKYHVPGPEDQ